MAKEDEIESLAKLGRSLLVLPSGEVSHSTNVSDTISRLNHDHSALSQQLEATRVRLVAVLRLWEAYQAALAAANQRLTEMDFSLSRCHSASGDLETFSAQIARLQTINAEFCQSQRQLDLLTNSAAELTEMCDEAVSKSLLHSVNQVKDGWHAALEAGEQRVWQFKEVTRAWQHYERETGAVRQWLTERDAEMGRLTSEADDALSREQQLHNAQTLRTRLDDSRDRLPLLGGLSAALIPHMDPTTAVRLTSAETALGQRLLQLQQGAAVLVGRCEAALQRAGSYDDTRGRVERLLADADAELERADPGSTAEADLIRARSAQLEALTLRFTDTQASLDSLNESGYRLALTAAESTALRRLNGRWHAALAAATERYKTQQARLLLQQDFSDKCREWMAFLGRVERDLAAEIVGNHDGLVAQQRAFDAFQSEMYARQQILAAIVSDGRRLLGDGAGTVDAAFQRKLSTLGAQWQSVVRRAAQRKAAIDGGVVRWREYRRRTDETDGRLAEMERGVAALEATGPASIERITAMLAAAKRILKLMQIFNIDESLLEVQKLLVGSSCVREASEHTVAGIGSVYQKVHELGNQLIATSDAPERARIEGSLGALHARWLALVASVEDRRTALEAVVRLWGDAEGGMEEALDWLKRVRGAVVTPMPDSYDGLQRELQQCEAFEETFEASAPKRDELAAQQRTLAASVGTEDSTILHQRLQLLGQQWDEILSQVELRKQGVLGRLQKWTTFNERQMELMGVLGAIEAKVNANSDLHIEDLLLKLNHEYKDEMTKVKVDCDAMAARGSELREGSSDVRASDIQHRVNELTTRWQQVQDTIANRTRKLSETLVAVQQLERNMSELRAWLARVERHLGSPVVYTECSRQQIEERLRDQQETQRDIERQSSGVASVLSLCEVLLRDADACPTANETAAIEQATESLQTRWHNICALSIQRKLRIEKSWRLWQKFNDQQQKLDDWLDEAEQKLQAVTSEEATFDTIKNEIRNVETIQSQVLDRLESLEQLNRLYRSLAREGRTDTGGGMKAAVTAVNQHWDDVAGRAAAVLRRRRHLAATFGDYTAEREAMLVWFAGVDEQLGALGRGRGCSALDARARAREVKALGEEMEAKEGHIEYVHRAATYLMQKCEEDDAVRIEAELSDFEQVCALIGAKLASNHSRLRTVSMGKVVRYKPRSAGHGRLKKSRKSPARASPDPSLTPVTPATLASIDWDLDGDDELDSEFPVEPPDVSSPDGLDEDEAERLESGRFQADLEWKWRLIKECIGADHQHQVELLLAGLERALADVSGQLAGVQRALRAPTAVGPHAQRLHHKYYETLVSSCEDGIDKLLTTESQLKSETGLTKIIGANTQIEGVLERWSTLQTEAQDKDSQLGQHRQQWAQFKVDLDNTLAWLDDADAIHSTQLDVPEDLRLLQVAARRHSDLQLQLDSRRPVVLSLNLVCREVAPPSREWRRVAARLDELNRRWDRVCARTAVWRGELHFALLHSAAFHDQLDRWRRLLAAAETELRRGEPVDVGAGEAALLVKYRRFREIHGDLSRSQVQILSLCEMALDLLSLPSSRSSPTMDSEDAAAARDRLNGLTTRLTTLLTTCVTHMSRIESAVGSGLPGPSVLYELDVASARLLTARSAGQPPRPLQRGMSAANSNDLDSERRDETGAVGTERGQRGRWARWGRWRRGGFLRRVLCTALPLQAFLLLLLGAACWLPLASREDQFSCVLANSLQHSLDPMLQYDNGPPPF